jgi:hypothetical protein
MYQSLMDHRSHILGRLVGKGELVEIPEDVARANQALYRKVDEKEAQQAARMMSRKEAEAIVLQKKLAKQEEVATLSLKQLLELAQEGV